MFLKWDEIREIDGCKECNVKHHEFKNKKMPVIKMCSSHFKRLVEKWYKVEKVRPVKRYGVNGRVGLESILGLLKGSSIKRKHEQY